MHRVGRTAPALPCAAPQVVRLYTTPPPVKARVPLKKWGDLVIPSRQEVIDLKAKRATADINYLKFENEKSLAARLARPTIDITLARKQALQTDAQTQLPNVSETRDTPSEKAETPTHEPTSVASTIEYMISQRREARLQRESERLAQKQRAEAERAQYAEIRIAREARRKEKAYSDVNDFVPLSQQPSSLKKATDPEAELRRERIAQLAAGLAEKRRLEREEREKQMESEQFIKKDGRSSHSPSHRQTSIAQRKEEELQIILNEESEDGGHNPEFLGPELPNDDIFRSPILHKPLSKRIQGGDYSHYVTTPGVAFQTPPDELGAAQVAEVALSHRRDVSLPQRHQSLDLIRKALDRKPRSAS